MRNSRAEVEVAEIAGTDVTPQDEPPRVRVLSVTDSDQYEVMARWYMDTFPALGDDSSIHAEIVGNILDQSGDSVLDVRESLDSSSHWIGRPIVLGEITSVMPSTYGGIFATVSFRQYDVSTKHPFGETQKMSVGSPQMLAQLAVLHRDGKLAGALVKIAPIRKGGTAGRNAPLYFRRIDY